MSERKVSRTTPFFSIVMPTRNRAHLLRYSLQTALEQTFDDYEIVVSDNDSSDSTAQVAHELADGHVRYVRTGKALSHPDSLEFAADQAEGEYTVFLFDDDALCPEALESVARVVDPLHTPIVSWDRGFYHHPSWDEAERVNTLELSPFNQQAVRLNSQLVLKGMYAFRGQEMHGFPFLIDAAFHKDIIKTVKEVNSRLFLEFLPEDLSFGITVLTRIDNFLHLDDVLSLFGKHNNSTTFALTGENREQKLTADYEKSDFQHVPFKSVTLMNLMGETLLKMKEQFPEKLQDCMFDWRIYFTGCYDSLMALQRRGIDVSAELAEFSSVLGRQPLERQAWVRQAIAYLASPRDSHWRKAIQRSPLLGQLELILRPGIRSNKNLVIRGKEAGFSNILECARFFNHSQRVQLARFWRGQRLSLPVKAEMLFENPERIT